MTEVLTEHTADELRAAYDRQRAAFLAEGPPSAAVRRDRIDRLTLMLTENATAIADAVGADFGSRPRSTSIVSEVLGIVPDLELTRARLATWMKPRRVLPVAGALGLPIRVEPSPLGVVGVIAPWNFPVGLLAEPAAAAFAAGNRVMAKASEVTARTGALLAELAPQYFDPAEFTVFCGGPQTAAAFSSLPFDHLFFTGSPQVGALVAQAAAANLTPVTLELGGKNPAAVGSGADVAKVGARIMAARLANGGQLCLCPDEVYVPRAQVHAFVDAAQTAARASFPSVLHGEGWVSIVNERNFDRVVGLIEDAVAKGAKKIEVAPPGERLPDRASRRIAPTILLDVTADMTIDSEEVFGPVLTVHPYDRIDDVIARLADRPAPLAAYWYGPTGPDFERFRSRTRSGGMTIDDFAAHCAVMSAPFGGVGRSGSGAYHGKAGFDTFSHLRTIVHNKTPVSVAQLMVPPYPRGYDRVVAASVGLIRRTARRRRARAGGKA
ncbi:aldehyde dehydrogenase family protein [Sporichthya brevicatena]|uniref:Aldehyde dehydrogenase n=1 Tax=Sporichthya brevicatena TaxID=171442 RepID=A0ABN1H3S6_9ACTN